MTHYGNRKKHIVCQGIDCQSLPCRQHKRKRGLAGQLSSESWHCGPVAFLPLLPFPEPWPVTATSADRAPSCLEPTEKEFRRIALIRHRVATEFFIFFKQKKTKIKGLLIFYKF